ncbi:MAG: 1-(5-phosphoribosyl)-5-[(5-phosphoribosylamino)methylideneamino] imidazole-4-carboxamide isomerase [Vicinamibacterales bacterium]
MLIPSIDLQRGRIVQLVQGEALALATDAIEEWIERCTGWPKVQLIDLDAAKGEGTNRELVARICSRLPCRVGGGIRSVERARETLDLGATHVILSSALFRANAVDAEFARRIADAIGRDRIIAAVDSKGGRVVIHGWRTALPLTAFDAIRELEPFVGAFLYTHVDREGLLQGADIDVFRRIREATSRDVIAAGGITTLEEIAQLDRLGIDAVVGMALYTGRLPWPEPPNRR